MKIFCAKEEDLPEILAIEGLSFPSPWSSNQFKDHLDQFLCAKIGDKTVGFIGIEKVPDEVRITHMAVHPIYRRQGIGKKLLEEVLKLDTIRFVLEVRASNEAAQALYENLGFKEACRRKKYYNDNDEDALVMIYEKKPA